MLKERAMFSPSSSPAALAALVLTLLFVPAAHGDSLAVKWTPPTPPDHARITARVGSPVSLTLTAATSVFAADAVVHIEAVRPPTGAVVTYSDGGAGRAGFDWTPAERGDYTIQFDASTNLGGTVATRTYVIHVERALYPRSYALSGEKVARWAAVFSRATVRSKPSSSAHVVTTLQTRTADGTQNVVSVLEGHSFSAAETWYRVRLAILPNNSTGWVRGEHLGRLFTVRTHLYVARSRMTATLKRDGVTIFSALVGIGRPASPTPVGEFYIRDKLTNFDDPFYGPVAFGTNGRSPTLTDWPAGGFIGVHGTDRPDLLPGRVSHGCIHMRNADLLRLARLMPVGTPVTVT